MATAVMFSTLLLLAGYFLVTRGVVRHRQALTNMRDTALMVESYSVANLLKAEVFDNFTSFRNENKWGACQTGLGALPLPDGPSVRAAFSQRVGSCVTGGMGCPAGCDRVDLALQYFTVRDEPGRTAVPLGVLLTTPLRLASALTNHNADVIVEQFNSAQNVLRGSLVMTPGRNRSIASANTLPRTVPFSVDLWRTVSAPRGATNTDCRICRALPGSVCCAGATSPELTLTYMDASGQILRGTCRPSTGVFTPDTAAVPSDPDLVGAQSAKENNGDWQVYRGRQFCVPGLSANNNDPVDYIVDAAVGEVGNFYLSSTGDLLTDSLAAAPFGVSGPPYELGTNPKIRSIAYDSVNKKWSVLRTDGRIIPVGDITDVASIDRTTGGCDIPTARRLSQGSGPAPCNVP